MASKHTRWENDEQAKAVVAEWFPGLEVMDRHPDCTADSRCTVSALVTFNGAAYSKGCSSPEGAKRLLERFVPMYGQPVRIRPNPSMAWF